MTPETWPCKIYLPAKANSYCFQLWSNNQFQLRITPPRKSKLGDYRYRPSQKTHLITINNNLNPYTFLVVYLHEVAHYYTSVEHGLYIKPHGDQWQKKMRSLLTPLMDVQIFPDDVLFALMSYLKAPKAASCSHPNLTRALRKYDPPSDGVPLEQLQTGGEFWFRSRKYQKGEVRRTRVACIETGTNRKWLINKLALVEPIKD
jgi:hypothetical protein